MDQRGITVGRFQFSSTFCLISGVAPPPESRNLCVILGLGLPKDFIPIFRFITSQSIFMGEKGTDNIFDYIVIQVFGICSILSGLFESFILVTR